MVNYKCKLVPITVLLCVASCRNVPHMCKSLLQVDLIQNKKPTIFDGVILGGTDHRSICSAPYKGVGWVGEGHSGN